MTTTVAAVLAVEVFMVEVVAVVALGAVVPQAAVVLAEVFNKNVPIRRKTYDFIITNTGGYIVNAGV